MVIIAPVQSIPLFIQGHGYIVLFILMLIEGPIVTLAASYAASFGVLNIFYIFVLSILGNLIPDMIYFGIGRYSRKDVIERFVHKTIISRSQLRKLEYNLKKHMIKSVVLLKITPFIPIPGIILSGFLRLPIKKFFLISLICNILTALIFVPLGFYLGLATINILKYIDLGGYLVLVGIFLTLIYLLYRKYWEAIRNKIRKQAGI